MSPFGSVPGTSHRHLGKHRTCWRDYVFCLAWESFGVPQGELESVTGERDVWVSLLDMLPPGPNCGYVVEDGKWRSMVVWEQSVLSLIVRPHIKLIMSILSVFYLSKLITGHFMGGCLFGWWFALTDFGPYRTTLTVFCYILFTKLNTVQMFISL